VTAARHGCALPARSRGVNRSHRSPLLGVLCVVSTVLAAGTARAVPVRRFFQPTDMEFEAPGTAELDMQFGLVRGEDAYRVSSPDFEFDLGLLSNLELDIDGEFAVAGPDTGEFTFDRESPDNLWTSLKLGLLDYGDEAGAWTAGIQLGPKLPLALGNTGVGVEGLVLVGWRIRQTQLVLNLGGLLDPIPDPNTPRPAAFEGGIDIARPLDADQRWTLSGGISGVRYVSPDNDQLNLTIGVTWSPTDTLDVSVLALGGVLSGGDRWGLLIGVSPKAQLW
jgi:hypothetical protein